MNFYMHHFASNITPSLSSPNFFCPSEFDKETDYMCIDIMYIDINSHIVVTQLYNIFCL